MADVPGTDSPGSTQVVISGGGPVGLATAVELGQRGISCVVVEPRSTVSHARPRCKTVNVRTMEHLRRWGLADRFRAAAPLPVDWSQDIVFCTSLNGHELSRFTGVLGLVREGDRFPETGQQAPQYVLEELLRTVVDELPTCTLLTGWRVVGVEQDATSVRVTVLDEAGASRELTADYLVGCDGARSTVRDQVGSHYVGPQALRPNFGMTFRAPGLWDVVGHGPAVQYWVVNTVAPAVMGPIDLDGTWWIIAFGVEEADGRRLAQELIDGAVGTHVDTEILAHDPWVARMQVVNQLRVGRVFLAGDSAHLNPPFGGHGLNTGVGDAVDLGWKLAAELQGWGGSGLLDSYELERRPVQERVIHEASENMKVLSTELMAPNLDDDDAAGADARRVADLRIQETKHAEYHALDLVLDIPYDQSPLVVGRGAGGGALAGNRLPHVWLTPAVSLYDRLGPGFTLVVLDGPDGAWGGIAEHAASSGVPLQELDLRDRDLVERYGAPHVLVRPDQYVAWRGDLTTTPGAQVLDQARGVPTPPTATPDHRHQEPT